MLAKRPLIAVWSCLVAATVGCEKQQPETPPGEPSITVGGVNDRLIMAAALVALPPPGLSPADLPDPQSAGAQNVARYCVDCHNIPSPLAHSATDWPGVARRMWLRIDLLPTGFAAKVPSMAERQSMLQYLIDHSLQVSGANLPEGPGRATFAQVCSRCHALPDPRQHSAADWPAVVLRMGQRMEQMKVTRPTSDETQEIVMYLQRVTGRRT